MYIIFTFSMKTRYYTANIISQDISKIRNILQILIVMNTFMPQANSTMESGKNPEAASLLTFQMSLKIS